MVSPRGGVAEVAAEDLVQVEVRKTSGVCNVVRAHMHGASEPR